MKRHGLLTLVFAIAVSACAVPDQGPLPSNVFSFEGDRSMVKDAAVEQMISRNYQITRDSDFQLAFDRPAPEAWLLGSRLYSTPNARVTMTFTGNAPTSVSLNAAFVTNPGSGVERLTDVTQNPEIRNDFILITNEMKRRLNETTKSSAPSVP